jgi:hypothetical protein
MLMHFLLIIGFQYRPIYISYLTHSSLRDKRDKRFEDGDIGALDERYQRRLEPWREKLTAGSI